jgi:hypothetical protein
MPDPESNQVFGYTPFSQVGHSEAPKSMKAGLPPAQLFQYWM